MNESAVMHRAAALALAGLLGACSLLKSERPAEHTWWLEPLPAGSPASGATRPELTVSVSVVPGLDTDRIVTLDPDARLNHYGGARWAEHAPELLESLVVRSLRATGLHAEVSARPDTMTGACHITLEASRFHARLDGNQATRSVEIELTGSYHCGDVARPLAARASVTASGNRMPVIVAAFQSGFNQAMRDLLDQM